MKKNTMEVLQLNFSDVNQDILMVCAFRYALGRRTYVVSTIASIMRSNWANIPTDRRKFFKKEISEAIKQGCAGHEKIDVPEWESILRLED